jgi:N-acetylglucosamine kinase-like BadF-type ATPase
MTLFIAVDGGNSKTDVVVGDTAGKLCSYLRGPGSSPHNLGLPGSLRLLDDLVGRALAAAGAASPAGDEVEQTAVFIAGADLPIEVERLTVAVGGLGWAPRTTVDNDTFALLRTGTSMHDAVGVVCGAGINCVGRRADGLTARFPALGQVSGDWGGGHHLAQLALYYAARAEDGRGRPTALVEAVKAHFGRSSVEQVSTALHLGDVPYERINPLSEVLFAVAAAGDPVARAVVRRQADEIVALARVAGGRLGLLDRPHALVLGGGVLTAPHPQLHEAIEVGVAAVAPHAVISLTDEPPVVGAALLALDELHGGAAPPPVEQAMRAALRTAQPTVTELA